VSIVRLEDAGRVDVTVAVSGHYTEAKGRGKVAKMGECWEGMQPARRRMWMPKQGERSNWVVGSAKFKVRGNLRH
jgi:hypothetical protein